MQNRQFRSSVPRRGAARARVVKSDRGTWVLAVLTAIGVAGLALTLGSRLAHSQSAVPEVVTPRREAPAGDAGTGRPSDGGVVAPSGNPAVIRPPVTGGMPVIPPPSGVGTMPIIVPPGSVGGNTGVVPK